MEPRAQSVADKEKVYIVESVLLPAPAWDYKMEAGCLPGYYLLFVTTCC